MNLDGMDILWNQSFKHLKIPSYPLHPWFVFPSLIALATFTTATACGCLNNCSGCREEVRGVGRKKHAKTKAQYGKHYSDERLQEQYAPILFPLKTQWQN
jgi:hypothetical protein